MKKYLMAAVALICMTMTCVSLAACSSDDNDESKSIIYYRASGNISGSSLSDLYVISDYTTAINSVVGETGYTNVAKDTEVIAACDAVRETHRTTHPTAEGTITITKYQGIDDETGKVLKTYEY